MSQKVSIPVILWVAIVSLAVFAVIHFYVGLSYPLQFFACAVNLVLIFGLLRLAKWSYFLTIIASLAGPILLSYESPQLFYIVLLLNCTVLIPVLLCTKVFFSKEVTQQASA